MKIVLKLNKKHEAKVDNEKTRKPLKIVIKHSGKRRIEAETDTENDGNPSKRMKIVIKKKGLKMVSSHCYITKNEEVKPLGEDAHFIADEEQTIGVADGVGSWAKRGIDSGEYARELMKNAIEAVHGDVDKERSKVDLRRVLQEAFSKTNLPGASTACIATHNNGVLHAINVGDSGFMVFRDNKLFYKSQTQQRRFNCPYQLGKHKKCENPNCAEEMEVNVMEGDVIVMATDGLLDNMHTPEMEEIVATEKQKTPEELAKKMAKVAYRHAKDERYVSPFEIANAMVGRNYKGGKVDDITVIVGKIIRHHGGVEDFFQDRITGIMHSFSLAKRFFSL